MAGVRQMSSWGKTFVGHAITVLVTLAFVAIIFGPKLAARKVPPVDVRVPDAVSNEPDAPPAPEQTTFKLPDVTPALPPAEQTKDYDPEEQINIRVYQAVNKSVVNITTESEGAGFFGDETSTGTGSGFVIDKKGHILTNFHVVENAENVQVTLYDGATHGARVIGVDASNDTAVVQVNVPEDKLSPVALGESSKLLVGQKILALGNPFGLERTLTTGIISSLDRSLRAKNGRMIKGIIQTDAAINPGNSGGPLLNSKGEVIGMNTAIVSQVGQSAGISFAVPINSIKRIVGSLIEHGRVIRADLGITRVYKTNEGLLVVNVVEGGPADHAGIRQIRTRVVNYGGFRVQRPDPSTADIIVAVNHKRVHNVDELLSEVEAHSPGQTVKVTVIRNGEPVDVAVRLGES